MFAALCEMSNPLPGRHFVAHGTGPAGCRYDSGTHRNHITADDVRMPSEDEELLGDSFALLEHFLDTVSDDELLRALAVVETRSTQQAPVVLVLGGAEAAQHMSELPEAVEPQHCNPPGTSEEAAQNGLEHCPSRKTRGSKLTKEDILAVQHLPLKEAATVVGLGTTQFKIQCRRLGISKWPHRQLKSISSLLQSCKQATATSTRKQQLSCWAGELERLQKDVTACKTTQLPDVVYKIRQWDLKHKHSAAFRKQAGDVSASGAAAAASSWGEQVGGESAPASEAGGAVVKQELLLDSVGELSLSWGMAADPSSGETQTLPEGAVLSALPAGLYRL